MTRKAGTDSIEAPRERAARDDTRLRYLYRSLVLHGKARISLEAAKRLVGPDCAYHLYSRLDRLAVEEKRGRHS